MEKEEEIKRIIKKRLNKGIREYFVKWKNFTPKHNSWEEFVNLSKEQIEQFYKKCTKRVSVYSSKSSKKPPQVEVPLPSVIKGIKKIKENKRKSEDGIPIKSRKKRKIYKEVGSDGSEKNEKPILKKKKKKISSEDEYIEEQENQIVSRKSKKKVFRKKGKIKKKKVLEEDEMEDGQWSEEQVKSLHHAMTKIKINQVDFWDQVAKYVKGKTANECQEKYQQPYKTPKKRASKRKVLSPLKFEGLKEIKGKTKKKRKIRNLLTKADHLHRDDVFNHVGKEKKGYEDLNSSIESNAKEFSVQFVTPIKKKKKSVNEDEEDELDQFESPGLLKKVECLNDIDTYVNKVKVGGRFKNINQNVKQEKKIVKSTEFEKVELKENNEEEEENEEADYYFSE